MLLILESKEHCMEKDTRHLACALYPEETNMKEHPHYYNKNTIQKSHKTHNKKECSMKRHKTLTVLPHVLYLALCRYKSDCSWAPVDLSPIHVDKLNHSTSSPIAGPSLKAVGNGAKRPSEDWRDIVASVTQVNKTVSCPL